MAQLIVQAILSWRSLSFFLKTIIEFLTMVAACNCPTDSTVKMNLSFFLPALTQKITYRNVVLVLDQVERLRCLLALHAKNAFFRPSHLEHVLSNVEHLCGAWVADLLLSLQTDFNRVVDLNLGFGMVGCQGAGCPLGVHLADALLYVKLYVDLLVGGQLDDGNSQLFAFADVGKIRDRLDGPLLLLFVIHAAEHWLNVKRSRLTHFLIGVLHTEDKILLAPATILYFLNWALALPGVIELVGLITNKGDQTDSLAEPLIVEYRGVFDDADEMGGQCGYLWDEDSAESVRQTHVATWQWKLQLLRTYLQDLDMKLLHPASYFYDSKYY